MAIQNLILYYPSGNIVKVKGECKGLAGQDSPLVVEVAEDTTVGDQAIPAGGIIAADPRCVCIDADSRQVLYNPRENLRLIEAGLQKWLSAHTEWPSVLELETKARKYSPPPWEWSDHGGTEAFGIRQFSGMPVVTAVMQLAVGHDAVERSKALDKAKRKARAKMSVLAPNGSDASLLISAPELFEACQCLLKATEPDADPSLLVNARSRAIDALKKATTPVKHIPPVPGE